MELKIKALSPKIGTEIPLPRFATAGAACMDPVSYTHLTLPTIA